jgi:hypothetical protein
MTPRPWLLLVFLASALDGCGDGSSALPPPDSNGRYVVFHFKMHGDVSGIMDFRAATNDAALIRAVRAQLQRPEHERIRFITGAIGRGNDAHNLAWNWHFVRNQWQLAEATIELCDGNAVMVSQAVDYWVDTVGRFCPWESFPAHEVPDGL